MPHWFWPSVTIANYVIALLATLLIIRNRKPPANTLAWILAFLLVPFLGVILYLLIGDTRIQRQVRKRRRRRMAIEAALNRQAAARSERLPGDSPGPGPLDQRLSDLVRISTRVGGEPPSKGNAVKLYFDFAETMRDLQAAIEAAQSHVHMEYYILQPDATGRAVCEMLMRKARAGVKCRLLLDAVGSIGVSRRMVREIESAGVEFAYFQPFRLDAKLFRYHCRNHRKIVIVDGTTVFTGSQNIGDEYLGRKRRFGPWRDTHLRITGPAALPAQDVFVEDWHFATQNDLAADSSLFPAPKPAGDSIVQLIATGPDRPPGHLHVLLLTAIAAARHTVRIVTPYFVPDIAMILSLQAAAMRGVRVQLMVPSRTDSRVVSWAGRSYYLDLVEAGVEVLEYHHGMLHSKVVIIDEDWSLVGSANMDVRSFNINFEVTALLYDQSLTKALAGDFDALCGRTERVTAESIANRPFHETLAVGLARLASPLL